MSRRETLLYSETTCRGNRSRNSNVGYIIFVFSLVVIISTLVQIQFCHVNPIVSLHYFEVWSIIQNSERFMHTRLMDLEGNHSVKTKICVGDNNDDVCNNKTFNHSSHLYISQVSMRWMMPIFPRS